MKKLIQILLSLFIELIAFGCISEKITVDPYGPDKPFETSQLISLKNDVQNSFLKADVKRIESLISPTYLSIYKSSLVNNASKLADFGTLLKSMKLVVGDSTSAVYQVDYKNVKYEVTFSKDSDGTWKLINF